MNSFLKPYLFLILGGMALLWSAAMVPAADFPGKESQWKGYALNQFNLEGVGCKVVRPKKAAPGKPWIWRARFWGHEPQTDIALLEKGWHVVYCEVGNLFGAPKAVARWDAFYAYLVKEHGFAKKAALEGMSRGGLIIYNWPRPIRRRFPASTAMPPCATSRVGREAREREKRAPALGKIA